MAPWYRDKAHKAFDRLWKEGHMSRPEAYLWLRQQFPDGLEHISEMDEFDCRRLIERVRQRLPMPDSI